MKGCVNRTSVPVVLWAALQGLLAWWFGGAQAQAQTWELAWSDEFDGGAIDRSNWTFDVGGRWGTELQYYTDRPENARVEVVQVAGESASCLVIEARQERYRKCNYTSARLKTQGLHSWTYGRIEARIKIPGGITDGILTGQGMWPAFWILGEDITSVGWPACGEVDIMENIGREPTISHGAVHGPGYTGAESIGGQIDLGTPVSDAFHVFAIEWEPDQIRWYVDDTCFLTVTPQDVPGPWVFDHRFFIILNVAVGGDWAGPPDGNTVFPQYLCVDYVRVYQQSTQPPPPPPGSTLHVASIDMSINQTGVPWQGVATVTVVDQDGAPVAGATVHGSWSGLVKGGTTDGVTDASGAAGPLYSTKTRSSGTITFRVLDIVKDGYTYREVDNVETSDSVTH